MLETIEDYFFMMVVMCIGFYIDFSEVFVEWHSSICHHLLANMTQMLLAVFHFWKFWTWSSNVFCIHVHTHVPYGDFHKWGIPEMVGLQGKIPSRNGWFGGTPISGNLHTNHPDMENQGRVNTYTIPQNTIRLRRRLRRMRCSGFTWVWFGRWLFLPPALWQQGDQT